MDFGQKHILPVILAVAFLSPVQVSGQSKETGHRIGDRVWREGKAPLTHSDMEHLSRGIGYEGARPQGDKDERAPEHLTMRGDEVFRDRLRANGLQLLDHIDNKKTGFQATLVKDTHTGKVYAIFRGTEPPKGGAKRILQRLPEFGKDFWADMGAVGRNQYEAKADNAKLHRWAEEHSGNLVVTGHSLGGALAQRFIADHPDDVEKAVLFNSPALDTETAGKVSSRKLIGPDGQPKITYYVHPGDPVSELGGNRHLYGDVYTVEGGPTEEGLLGVHSGAMLQGGTVMQEKDFHEWQENRKSEFLGYRATNLSKKIKQEREAAREALREADRMRDTVVDAYTRKTQEAVERGDYEEAERWNKKLSDFGARTKDSTVEQAVKDINKQIDAARSGEVAAGPDDEEKKDPGAEPQAPEGEGPPEELPESPEELLTDIGRTFDEKGTEPPVEVEPPEGPGDAEKATKDLLAKINTILKNPLPIKKKGDKPEPGPVPPEGPETEPEAPEQVTGVEPEPPTDEGPSEEYKDAEASTRQMLAGLNAFLKELDSGELKRKNEPETPAQPEPLEIPKEPPAEIDRIPEERSRDIGAEMTAAFAGALASDLEAFIREENLPKDLNAIEKRLSQRVAEIDAELARINELLYAGQEVDEPAAVALAKRRQVLLILRGYVETKGDSKSYNKRWKGMRSERFDWDTERAEQRKVYEEALDRYRNVDHFLMETIKSTSLEQWKIQQTIETLESMVEVFEATNSPYLPTAKEYLDRLRGLKKQNAQ